MSLLKISNLNLHFQTDSGKIYAVNNFDFKIQKEQIVGIVGESGSGKSVSLQSILGLLPNPPCVIESGTANFEDKDLLKMKRKELQKIRGNQISMIFQDPMTSLNPYLKIGNQITEPLFIHHKTITKKEAKEKVLNILDEVKISQPQRIFDSYPYQLSGGMRQRVAIAIALINHPKIWIADEPTTALDVTIQKQVINLLLEEKQRRKASLIFISHDLALVSEICDWVYVMYAGSIVEAAETKKIFETPLHSYTQSLLASSLYQKKKDGSLVSISGLPPILSSPPNHCCFKPRNERGDKEKCLINKFPKLKRVAENHYVQDCPGCLKD